jgi:Fe-S cluster biogenesis protein NfuA
MALVAWTIHGHRLAIPTPQPEAALHPAEQTRPLAVAGHAGFVQLVDAKDNRVYLQMGGGCQGCGAADITLKAGIERMIKEEIPEIEEVLDTTDHASGENPYYTPGK